MTSSRIDISQLSYDNNVMDDISATTSVSDNIDHVTTN